MENVKSWVTMQTQGNELVLKCEVCGGKVKHRSFGKAISQFQIEHKKCRPNKVIDKSQNYGKIEL